MIVLHFDSILWLTEVKYHLFHGESHDDSYPYTVVPCDREKENKQASPSLVFVSHFILKASGCVSPVYRRCRTSRSKTTESLSVMKTTETT